VRGVPSRISPETFPIAAAATAPAYDFSTYPESAPVPLPTVQPVPEPGQQQQQQLFTTPVNDPRVVAFDSLTTQAERESIRARAADLARPAPVKTARVEVRRPRVRNSKSLDQGSLGFQEQREVLSPPVSNIICDAPVAPVRLRAEAACIDGLLMLAGYALPTALFVYKGGEIPLGNHALAFLFLALITVPLFYKLIWTLAGRDTLGMQCARIRLVDFDGNPPSQERRYARLFGSILSFLAAGVGLIWTLVDQDRLSWHDHISSTFPTLDSDY
jgi:uncharacterized RDD family membrane protein YckC